MGLKDQLADILPADFLPYVSDHFEVIGDIAVLAVPAELEPWKDTIAQAIISRRKNIAAVLNKKEKVSGRFTHGPVRSPAGGENGHGAPRVRVLLPSRCRQGVFFDPHGI